MEEESNQGEPRNKYVSVIVEKETNSWSESAKEPVQVKRSVQHIRDAEWVEKQLGNFISMQ